MRGFCGLKWPLERWRETPFSEVLDACVTPAGFFFVFSIDKAKGIPRKLLWLSNKQAISVWPIVRKSARRLLIITTL